MPTCVVIIPARYASSRFPGKPLVPIAGRPMIQQSMNVPAGPGLSMRCWWRLTMRASLRRWERSGGHVVLTSAAHPSGTDRIAEVAAQQTYDIVVNVQGDEPCIAPQAIDALIQPLRADPQWPSPHWPIRCGTWRICSAACGESGGGPAGLCPVFFAGAHSL